MFGHQSCFIPLAMFNDRSKSTTYPLLERFPRFHAIYHVQFFHTLTSPISRQQEKAQRVAVEK